MEWPSAHDVVRELAGRPRDVIFFLGGPDIGKTTLLRRLAQLYVDAGMRTGLVDADVGQSTIGPPTTVGMVLADGALPDLFEAHGLHFVGSNNPVAGHTEVLVGSARMVDEARKAGAGTVIVDSSGLVQGPYGISLKYQKLELLHPQAVVALEKGNELAPILSWLSGCWDVELFRVRPPAEARSLSAAQRTRYRQSQYRRYFAGATVRELAKEQLRLYPPGFLDGTADPGGLLVGLQAQGWRTVAIGIVESVGVDTVGVYAPYPPGARICGLVAGRLKLSRTGEEIKLRRK